MISLAKSLKEGVLKWSFDALIGPSHRAPWHVNRLG